MNIYDRLVRFFAASGAGQKAKLSPLWNFLLDQKQTQFIAVLKTGSGTQLRKHLQDITEKDSSALYGLDHFELFDWESDLALLRLENLAQSIGILPFYANEQPSISKNWKMTDSDATLHAVESKLGWKLSIPDCFGFKAPSGKSGVPARMFAYSAAAFSIKSLFHGVFPKRVLEIGAGLGNLGYISSTQGVEQFTVIDIPSVAVLSAFFMSKVVGEDRVWLYGEHHNPAAFARFLPCTDYAVATHCKYDVVFNSDSLPEMTPAMQDEYMSLASRVLDKDGILFSVNHESDNGGQSSVNLAVARNGHFRMKSRHPFHLRQGYVEEVFATQ